MTRLILFTLFIIFGLLPCLSSSGQNVGTYYPAKIILKDKSVMDGIKMRPPTLQKKAVYYKVPKKFLAKSVPNDEVDQILIEIDGIETVWVQVKANGKLWNSKKEFDVWVQLIEEGEVSFYRGIYIREEDNHMHNTVTEIPYFGYYLRNSSDDVVKAITQRKLNGNFRGLQEFYSLASEFFADYETLSSELKAKKYHPSELKSVVMKYNEWALQKQ